jgi:structure-specific recognition protein 1
MHADFLRLRGKTYDYRIAYNQVQKLFLLPKPDDIHCQFVVRSGISLGAGGCILISLRFLRSTSTRLSAKVRRVTRTSSCSSSRTRLWSSISTSTSAFTCWPSVASMLTSLLRRDTIKEKYDGNLKARYDDPAFEVVSILFRVLAARKVVTPGNFQSYVCSLVWPVPRLRLTTSRSLSNSHDGHSAVKCNLKANEGQLYFLEKQLLFISKQPTLVPHADISAIIFARYVPLLSSLASSPY